MKHHHMKPEHHHHRRGRRLFDYGELRLLVLAMIAERPRHGYDIIKDIGERFAGRYAPSPGVIYPTLSWLEDTGYVRIEADAAGHRLSHLLPEGAAFLAANKAAVSDLMQRRFSEADEDPVERGMTAIKRALRGSLRAGGADPAQVAAILDDAASRIAALAQPGSDPND